MQSKCEGGKKALKKGVSKIMNPSNEVFSWLLLMFQEKVS